MLTTVTYLLNRVTRNIYDGSGSDFDLDLLAFDGVLVFTDLLGGTPFNQSMMIAQDVDNVEVLTGTNLPR